VCLTKSYKVLESFGRKDHRLFDRFIGIWIFPNFITSNPIKTPVDLIFKIHFNYAMNHGVFTMKRIILSTALFIGSALQGHAADEFKISFKWCSGSPEVQLNNVPKNTSLIEFRMIDFNAPSYNHGGGKVKFNNQKSISCGEFSSTYEGPSPPPPSVHTYEITAVAKDKDGNALGTAKATKKFPE